MTEPMSTDEQRSPSTPRIVSQQCAKVAAERDRLEAALRDGVNRLEREEAYADAYHAALKDFRSILDEIFGRAALGDG